MNGKIVVSENITDIAWNFGERKTAIYDEANKKIREEFKPEWLDIAS